MTEDEFLAAELALGLLNGEELLMAHGRAASDPRFAALVADWDAELAPLLDGVEEAQPDPELWARIVKAIDDAPSNGGEVIAMHRRLRRWQWGSAAASAAALVIGLVGGPLLQSGQQGQRPAVAASETLLFASLPVGGPEGPRLDLTYQKQTGGLVVLAGGVAGDGVHDHELWLVAPDIGPISIGVIAPGQVKRMQVPAQVAERLGAGLGVVLTREPLGGARPGTAAGPVVAEGKFSQI